MTDYTDTHDYSGDTPDYSDMSDKDLDHQVAHGRVCNVRVIAYFIDMMVIVFVPRNKVLHV